MNQSHPLRRQFSRTAWLMSLPALIGLALFVILPLVLGGYWSLTDKRLISPLPTEFVGLQNYDRLLALRVISQSPETDPATGEIIRDETGQAVYPRLRAILRSDESYTDFSEWFSFEAFGQRHTVIAKDPTFLRALVNTAIFVLVIVPGQGGLALFMALLVNQRLKGMNLFRTIYFSPVVTSMAVIAIVWRFLYNPDAGLINRFLEFISFGHITPPGWLVDSNWALIAIILLSTWQAAGFQMVIFLAGLQGIPDVLYEAAQVDGANTWHQFRHVTLPMLRNTIIFVIIATTILAFRVFTQIDVLTKGGPQNSTVTLVFDAVEQGFRQQRIGYGSAITVIFFVIVVALALIQNRLMRSEKAMED